MQPNYLGSGQLAQNLAGASAFTNFLDQSARRPLENQIVDTTEQNQLAQQQAVPAQLAAQNQKIHDDMEAQTRADHMKVLANTGIELDNIKDPAEKAARYQQIKAQEAPNWQGVGWADQYSPDVQAVFDHAKNQVYGDKIQASRDKIAEEQAKPLKTSELGGLLAERDALAKANPNDPNIAVYNAAIQKANDIRSAGGGEQFKVVPSGGVVFDTHSGKPINVGGGGSATNPNGTPNDELVTALGEGRVDPKMFNKNRPLMEEVAKQYPQFDGTLFAKHQKAENAFSTGTQGNSVRQFGVSLDHLDTLQQLGDALKNNDTQALNRIGNFFAQQTGEPAVNNFETAKIAVSSEVAKAIAGANVGVADREHWMNVISAANSPAKLAGAINTLQHLMLAQLNGLETQYKRSTGRKEGFTDDFLSERSRAVRDRLNGNESAPASDSPVVARTDQHGDITEADIQTTMQKYGITREQVLQKLGIAQ